MVRSHLELMRTDLPAHERGCYPKYGSLSLSRQWPSPSCSIGGHEVYRSFLETKSARGMVSLRRTSPSALPTIDNGHDSIDSTQPSHCCEHGSLGMGRN